MKNKATHKPVLWKQEIISLSLKNKINVDEANDTAEIRNDETMTREREKYEYR